MASDATKSVNKIENKGKKSKKPKEKKPSVFSRIGRYCKDVAAELKRVTWPTRKELIAATGAVLIFVIAMTAVVGVLDFGFYSVMQLVSKIGGVS